MSSGWTNTSRFVSTSSTTACRNAFWAIFRFPAICSNGIQAAQKSLGLFHWCIYANVILITLIGWHGQAVKILQGPLLLKVSRKRLPTTCLISLWGALVPWWWMHREDQTLFCYQMRSQNSSKKGKKFHTIKTFIKCKNIFSLHNLWSPLTIIPCFICQINFCTIYSCIKKNPKTPAKTPLQ